jgi:hypothetical protein
MFISKKAVIAGVSTLVLVGGGAALALFTTSGSGTESVRTAAIKEGALTLSVDTSDMLLIPGNDGVLNIQGRNTDNDVPLTVTSIAPLAVGDVEFEGGTEVDGETCGPEDFTSRITTRPDNYLAPGGGTDKVGELEWTMLKDVGNECQGVKITFTVRANAANALPAPTP